MILQRLKIRHAAYALAVAAFAVYAAFLFAAFARSTRDIYLGAGRVPSNGVKPLKVDAIVVLTGGKGRIPEGIALLRAGKGKVLIISGVASEASADSIFRGKLTQGELAGVILEKRSTSTYENAVEVRKLALERGFKSVVLITSIYHMKRAAYIFRQVMPPGVLIEPYFVTTPNFNENSWWDSKSMGLLAIEFMKYCWYELKFALEGA
ncbi:MAG: YdcF family protein [Deltaproteobacteria bacterium]|nr:YdcF family protein [Deltaproteobacteria bacterium]